MYDLDSKENFKKELNSLIRRLDEHIKAQSEKVTITEGAPSNGAASEINELKVHRYKMKEALIWVNDASDEKWRAHKGRLQEAFKEADNFIA